MLSCYGAPLRARVRTGLRTDRRSSACTVSVRRGDREARGARAPMHRGVRVGLGKECVSGSVRPRSATTLGADAEAARARGGGVAARGAGRHESVLLIPCLSTNISKIWNRTLPIDEYESCRSSNPLPLSKRLYGVFLNRFCRKRLPTLNVSLCP
jgi:hypothetical protein